MEISNIFLIFHQWYDNKVGNFTSCYVIVANRPYLGGTVPIFYAKFPTVPIFLDCVPIFLNSLNVQNSAILSSNLVILTIFNLLP